MKATKKLLACFLALVMMFSMGLTAFAAGGTTYEDQPTVTIMKQYSPENEGTASPAATFTFRQVGEGEVLDGEAQSAPALTSISSVEFSQGDVQTSKPITVTLPTYDRVGVYGYTLAEVSGNVAGVNYDSTTVYLKVTVMLQNGQLVRQARVYVDNEEGKKLGDNDAAFENTYSVGTLSVTKTVDGNLGDTNKYFAFTVTLTGDAEKTGYADAYEITGGSYENPETIAIGSPVTVYLKHGETISIANLPYGVSYTVTETDYESDGYETTKSGDTGTINAATQTASFTNTKTGEVDTGITLDSLPYILIVAVVLGAGAAFIISRRKVEE